MRLFSALNSTRFFMKQHGKMKLFAYVCDVLGIEDLSEDDLEKIMQHIEDVSFHPNNIAGVKKTFGIDGFSWRDIEDCYFNYSKVCGTEGTAFEKAVRCSQLELATAFQLFMHFWRNSV